MSPVLTDAGTASSSVGLVRDDAPTSQAQAFLLLPGAPTGSDYSRPQVLPETVTTSHPARMLPHQETHIPEAAEIIGELRERTDLTWDETARLFGVSRRAALYWASGANAMTAARQRRLNQIVEIIGDFEVPPTQMQAALRKSVQGRSIIEIIAMGAPPELIRAHLASHLGPGRRRQTEPWQPRTLLPEHPHNPRRVSARSRLLAGAGPVFDPEDPTAR